MIVHNTVKPNTYYDSVTLMLISSKLLSVAGVSEAAVMMGTEHNKALMINSGVLAADAAEKITPNDLVIGIAAESQQAVDEAVRVMEEGFVEKKQAVSDTRAKTLEAAVKTMPDLNFAIISLPGKFAKREAMKALKEGMHVLLFSDNVSVAEEQELKTYAVHNNLLMMGPDCGTAIINGVGLGFANAVRRGSIGFVAAAGTGLQEATVIVDRLGGGVSQALGTGGRDIKDELGGKMMLAGLEALSNDPNTEVIGIVSKPPSEKVMAKIAEAVAKNIKKPVVACFLGGDAKTLEGTGIIAAETMEDAASFLVSTVKGAELKKTLFSEDMSVIEQIADEEASKISAGQKYIRGLYSGGTLCAEANIILQKSLGDIYSNISGDARLALSDVEESRENTLLDMGDDYFTDGMPHPMIDTRLRVERIKKEAANPDVAVILLDCVLGYGCNEDPAGAVAAAIKDARAAADGRYVSFVASVCGTPGDIQNRTAQEETLRQSGVIVMPSNAQASRIAAMIISRLNEKNKGR